MIEESAYVLKLKVSRKKAKKELENAILKGESVLMLYRNYNESVSNKRILIQSTQTSYFQIPEENQIRAYIDNDEIRYKWCYYKSGYPPLYEKTLPCKKICRDTVSLSDDIKAAILKSISESGCRIFSDKHYRQWQESTKGVLGFIGNSAWITQLDKRHTKNITHSDEPLLNNFEGQLSFLEESLKQIKNIPRETNLHKLIKWVFTYVIKVAVERTVDNTIGSPK